MLSFSLPNTEFIFSKKNVKPEFATEVASETFTAADTDDQAAGGSYVAD
jgi:hypothetical protein